MITFLPNIRSKKTSVMTMQEIVSIIKEGYKPLVQNYGKELSKVMYEIKQKGNLPAIMFSALSQGGHSIKCITHYKNRFVADIDKIESMERLLELKEKLSKESFVELIYITPSSRGLKVIIRLPSLARTSNILENKADEQRFKKLDNFHKAWFNIISHFFKDKYNIEIDSQCSNVNRLSFIGYDPNVYYNSKARVFCFKGEFKDIYPLYLNLSANNPMEYGNRDKAFFVLCNQCVEKGIETELMQRFGQKYSSLSYKQIQEKICSAQRTTSVKGNKRGKNSNIITNQQIIERLLERYEYRYNSFLRTVEYKDKESKKGEWKTPMSSSIDTMILYVSDLYPTVSVNKIKSFINSELHPKFDPIIDFFAGCGSFEEVEQLKNFYQLCDCLQTQDNELLRSDLLKFMIGMLVTASLHYISDKMEDVEKRYTSPFQHLFILAGNGGYNKTRFFEFLLPKELKQYFSSTKSDINSSNFRPLLKSKMLINFDECENLFERRNYNTLKSILTEHSNNYVEKYEKNDSHFERRCVFCGTINDAMVLKGDESERRYMIHSLTKAVDLKKLATIDMRKVYAEILYQMSINTPCWLSYEEVKKRKKHNEKYTVLSDEAQAIQNHFKVPENEIERRKSMLYSSSDLVLKLKEIGYTNFYASTIGKVMRNQLNIKVDKQKNKSFYRLLELPNVYQK